MKHEYSAQQIEEASNLASSGYTRIGVDYLLAFLDALPEPVTNEADEWEPCEYVDYRPGDRMMRENNRIILVYKSPIREVHEHHVELEDKNFHDFRTDMTYYRIPAPIQHPDPAEHPVIVNVAVEKPGTNSTHRYDYATWDAEEYYDCWGHDGKYYGGWQPSTITDWSPAKVVEDGR